MRTGTGAHHGPGAQPGAICERGRRPSRTPTIVDRLRDTAHGKTPFSVEFYPPRNEVEERRLWRAVHTFETMGPAFVSLTYGAGGSTRDRTIRIAGQLAEQTSLLTVAHLTAVGHSTSELRTLIGSYADRGIVNVLALRGDPPGDPLGEWKRHPEGLEYAGELVRLIRRLGDFHVGVASFPEGHHRAKSLEEDTAFLVDKLRAGAEYSITQMFFDVDDYLRLRDRVAKADPEQGAKPIIPGVMPITSLRTVRKMVELSGSALPAELEAQFQRAAGSGPKEDQAAVRELGIELSTRLAERLIAEGAPCLHFCSLNFTRATQEVLANLGLAPVRV